MNEENPLHFIPHTSCSTYNKSGRPKNENSIKFSPQPRSLISQMLKKIKKENDYPIMPDYEDSDAQTKNDNENDFFDNVGDVEKIIELKHDTNMKNELLDEPKINKNIYPCDYPKCTYISKLSSNLTKHKRTHTMEKPYLCDQCSFRSNFVNSLKVHKRIHSNERPFSCNFCSYRCNSSSNLKKHCKYRHSNEACDANEEIKK